ncbi:MucB/RseB C-terminal domain-containing protein [Zhongshania aliphaticivorans]|uniref:MucB/RseB C-terminal domain-containing protein n=1 Tax=Zhongshania aliphaticivorans TaxID=1470434 RepID=UPI0012E41690|nr:MucB/RseB C-terminal domain-containing protein [Zhongshania aliphaticivorans]CAA0080604.1 Sigma factor AlgU regulatory protein MucB [Zhongshania aliphaticivorans]
MIVRLAFTALAAILVSAPVFSLESGSELLNKMTHSHRELNYRAIVTYQLGEQLSSYRITHTVHDGKEFEALESLDGNHQDLVHHGHDVNCVHPGPQLIRLFNADDEQGFYRYYDVDVEGEGRVAGRDAVILSIKPRDVYRLGYKLSLDSETGLLLRSDIVNQQGKVLERFQYVMLDLNIPDNELIVDGAIEVQHKDVAVNDPAAMHIRVWRPDWIPAGFTPLKEAGDGNAAMTYTDGLAVMSVFVEPLLTTDSGAVAVTEGGMRRGASVSYTVAFPESGMFATVVGEVPMLTAKQVAKSLSWDQR